MDFSKKSLAVFIDKLFVKCYNIYIYLKNTSKGYFYGVYFQRGGVISNKRGKRSLVALGNLSIHSRFCRPYNLLFVFDFELHSSWHRNPDWPCGKIENRSDYFWACRRYPLVYRHHFGYRLDYLLHQPNGNHRVLHRNLRKIKN